jgi:hypothetical protein
MIMSKIFTFTLLITIVLIASPALSQKKFTHGLQFSPNILWNSKIETKEKHIYQYPAFGASLGYQFQKKMNQFVLENEININVLRSYTVVKVQDDQTKYRTNIIFTRFGFTTSCQYHLPINEEKSFAFSFGATSLFGASFSDTTVAYEYTNITSYTKNYSQLFHFEVGIYKVIKKRTFYTGIRNNFGSRIVGTSTILFRDEASTYVDNNTMTLLIFKIYFNH